MEASCHSIRRQDSIPAEVFLRVRRFRQQSAGRFNRQNAYRAELRSGDESCSGWPAGRVAPTDRRHHRPADGLYLG